MISLVFILWVILYVDCMSHYVGDLSQLLYTVYTLRLGTIYGYQVIRVSYLSIVVVASFR